MADKIFINYRRDDMIGTTGRLHDRLTQTFGLQNIFNDRVRLFGWYFRVFCVQESNFP